MKIKGYAELNSTKNYFFKRNICTSKHNDYFYSLPIATGTYLGDFSDEHSMLYRESISYSLLNGINFIDTAINYRGMRSEKDVGIVIKKLIIDEKKLNRDEIVISSKGGLIFGDYDENIHPKLYLEKLIKNNILCKDDISIAESDKHTLNPAFYKISIEKSRENLNLETIDIHYIHDPEISMYVLGPDIFYKKLYNLLEFYESQADEGTIHYYGMATWNAFVSDIDSKWNISLEKVIHMVKSIAGDKNHFKFIQLPYNKINTAANTKNTQKIKGSCCSAIQAANELGINVMANAPLNELQNIKDNFSASDMIRYVTNTKGIYAAIVGSKTVAHTKSNLGLFI